MKIHDVRNVATSGAAARGTRPSSAVVHDGPDARLVLFRFDPEQEVPPHVSSSSVLLTILEGEGVVSGADGERDVHRGDVVSFEPNELHGMRSRAESFVVLATIAPRPGTR